MTTWMVQRQSYQDTYGLFLDSIGSGSISLPNLHQYDQAHYLWWRHDKNSPTIDGHSWWENTTLPSTGTNEYLGLNDLVFLKFASEEASYNYFLIFPDLDPNIFKTDYEWPWSSYVYTGSYDPSESEYLNLFLKSEYQNLTPQITESYRESQETQIRELLYIANHQCCTCAEPAASCRSTKVPESTPTASLLLLGIFGIILLLKRNLKPKYYEKTKTL